MGKKRQNLGSGDFQSKMDELYRQANEADRLLGHFMRDLNTRFTGVIVHPPLKKRETAEEKLTRGGANEPPESLGDICRATIKYNRLETLFSARDYIQSTHAALVDGVKDRYSAQDPVDSGYRDIKFFIKMRLPDGNMHVCELQLNLSTALVAKELEHPVYEIIRRQEGQGAPVLIPANDAKKLGPQLRAVYIMTKKAGILTNSEAESLLSVVLQFFVDRATQRPKPGSIALEGRHVTALSTITPKLFRHYEEQAMRAKVMTANGLQAQMSAHDLAGFTGNRPPARGPNMHRGMHPHR